MSIVGGGGIVGLLIVGWLVFGGNNKPPDAPKQEVVVPTIATQAASTSWTTANEVAVPAITEIAVPASSPDTVTSHPEAVSASANDVSKSERVESAAHTPTEICKGESNFFSLNNCMWRECEKPEFADLQECENKKAQRNFNGE